MKRQTIVFNLVFVRILIKYRFAIKLIRNNFGSYRFAINLVRIFIQNYRFA